jgi:ribosomal protein S18 acetylase RimI-like enzyme
MKITLSDVPDYIAFFHPALSAAEREVKAKLMIEDFSQYCGDEEVVHLSRDAQGAIEGAMFCIRLQEGWHAAGNVIIRSAEADAEIFERLMRSALEGKKNFSCRIISGPTEEGRIGVLRKLGFFPGEQRQEFRADVAELPLGEGGPFAWAPLPDLSEDSLDRAGDILQQCGMGDPDFSPEDNGRELVRVYLKERGLSSVPQCIQIGTYEGKSAALVVAQVQASNGWSRITYMGMLPEFRGRGWGKWVHRQGFTMLKHQGGKLYHGGTLAKNHAMISLFKKHGCKPYREMQEWKLERSEA